MLVHISVNPPALSYKHDDDECYFYLLNLWRRNCNHLITNSSKSKQRATARNLPVRTFGPETPSDDSRPMTSARATAYQVRTFLFFSFLFFLSFSFLLLFFLFMFLLFFSLPIVTVSFLLFFFFFFFLFISFSFFFSYFILFFFIFSFSFLPVVV